MHVSRTKEHRINEFLLHKAEMPLWIICARADLSVDDVVVAVEARGSKLAARLIFSEITKIL